jgi:transposase
MLAPLQVFRELIEAVDAKLKVLTAQIAQAAPQTKPLGLGNLTHEMLDREVGDWNRFKNRRQVGSYAGLTGGVSASGQSKADLSITKAGHPRLRSTLVEAAWRLLLYQSEYWLVKKWKHVLCNPKAHARSDSESIFVSVSVMA